MPQNPNLISKDTASVATVLSQEKSNSANGTSTPTQQNKVFSISVDTLKELFDLGMHPLPIYRNLKTGEIFHPDWQTDIKSGNTIHDIKDALRWLANMAYANELR